MTWSEFCATCVFFIFVPVLISNECFGYQFAQIRLPLLHTRSVAKVGDADSAAAAAASLASLEGARSDDKEPLTPDNHLGKEMAAASAYAEALTTEECPALAKVNYPQLPSSKFIKA